MKKHFTVIGHNGLLTLRKDKNSENIMKTPARLTGKEKTVAG